MKSGHSYGYRSRGIARWVGFALAFAFAGLAIPRSAAATFVVDSTDDTVAVDPAASPKDADGKVSLRSAIMAANAQTGPDVVVLSSGVTYSITRGPADSSLGALDDSSGDLDITDALTLLGHGATVDAGGIDRAFAIESPTLQDFKVSLEKVLVQDGTATGFLSPGGGISVRAATLEMTDCIVARNTTVEAGSSGNGGGIAANGVRFPAAVPARLTLRGCTVTGNVANNGGGILAADCLLDVSNTIVSHNQALGTDAGTGGANVFLTGSATSTTIKDSRLSDGIGAADGGGLSTFTAAVRIENSMLSGNAADGDGGGVFDLSLIHIYEARHSRQ